MVESVVELTLPIGIVLNGRYEIVKVLGVGGFGITYLALHTNLRKQVAIKEYKPRDFSYRDQSLYIRPNKGSSSSRNSWQIFEHGLKRFLKEAQDLVQFSHPHIVKATDYFEEFGTAYFVMDYVKGETLEYWLTRRNNAPDEELLKSIFLPLLDGLGDVHKNDLLHRDIKPDNIYLQADGTPLLIDFGAARSAVGVHSRSVHVVVAEGYSPKEQYATSGRQGPWTDIYAVGATMLRCISRQVPVGAMDRSEALDHAEPDPMISASVMFKGQYSDSLLNTIDRCLHFSGPDRPQSVREVQDGILGTGRATGVGPTTARVSRRIESQYDWENIDRLGAQGRQKILLWVAAPLLISGVAALAYFSGALDSIIKRDITNAQNVPIAVDVQPPETPDNSVEQPPMVDLDTTNTPVISQPVPESGPTDFRVAEARFTHVFERLDDLRVVMSSDDKQWFVGQRELAASMATEERYESGVDILNSARIRVSELLASGSRLVRVGSTDAQINTALKQCEAFYGETSCAPVWFEIERQRTLEIKPFSMDIHEVTFEQFAQFAQAQGYTTEAEARNWSLLLLSTQSVETLDGYTWREPEGPGSSWDQFKDQPVTHVSLKDAQAYCSARSGRLPTRQEWEYSATLGNGGMYASYFSPDNYSISEPDLKSLSSEPVNAQSIFDPVNGFYGLTGNVWEWTSTFQSGSAIKYFVKGGSWKEPALVHMRNAALRPEYPSDSYIDVGFRCVTEQQRWP